MQTLFMLVLLLCLMAIIIGLINPKFVLWWSSRQKRSDVLIFYVWGIIASASMVGVALHRPPSRMGLSMAIVAWLLWFGYWRKLRKVHLFSGINSEASALRETEIQE